MEFEINTEFSALDGAALDEYAVSAAAALMALVDIENPTDEDVELATSLAAHIDEVEAEREQRAAAQAERDQRLAALRERFSAQSVEDEQDEDEEPEEDEDDVEDSEDVEPVEDESGDAAPPARARNLASLAAKVKRPAPPEGSDAQPFSIVAAANVTGNFASGQTLDMTQVGEALVERVSTFSTPNGDGKSENFQHYGVAKFKMNFPKELTIDAGTPDDMVVLNHARDESRLEGNSLVASGGWCAPSETLYDLCAGETIDGIVSIPEVNVARGGIKYTSGPDFSTIYSSVGFLQTEAQAISGTTKDAFEVPCPSFTETRLDAIGLFIKAPILTNAAYPEVVQRWLTGSMTAHAYKVNASVLTRMDAAAGTARVAPDSFGTAASTLGGLEMYADHLRQKWRLGMNATMEVVLPYWVKGAIRSDLALRQGQDNGAAVTDQMIAAHFAARKLNVQFAFGYGELDVTTDAYPATYNALIYPAGTFVKGVNNVITLNAVYDAASLAGNVYTALFFEQGLLVAKMCYEATKVTLPICNSGKTGAANIDLCPAV